MTRQLPPEPLRSERAVGDSLRSVDPLEVVQPGEQSRPGLLSLVKGIQRIPSFYKPIIVLTLGLIIAGASLFGCEGQTQPSQEYLQDDIQYFPGFPPKSQDGGLSRPNVRLEASSGQHSGVLGELVFTDVVSVHFIGPGHPANPDGSLRGFCEVDDGEQMRIYERYIVVEATDADGTTIRALQAYDEIGRIVQRIPPQKVSTQ